MKWVVFESFDRKGMLGAFTRGLVSLVPFAGVIGAAFLGVAVVGGLQWNCFK